MTYRAQQYFHFQSPLSICVLCLWKHERKISLSRGRFKVFRCNSSSMLCVFVALLWSLQSRPSHLPSFRSCPWTELRTKCVPAPGVTVVMCQWAITPPHSTVGSLGGTTHSNLGHNRHHSGPLEGIDRNYVKIALSTERERFNIIWPL